MDYRGYVKIKNQKGFMVEVLTIDLSATPNIYYTKDKDGNQNYKTGGELVLMENTGIKDGNDNNIFEGDILYSHQYPDIRFKVRKTDGGFVINEPVAEWQDDNWPSQPLADMQTKSWLSSTCVVIGNIYQDIDNNSIKV